MLNHHHDFHDNSRQNKINNILLYHNTTIMSESTIDYTPLSILVRMGLCRDKTCQGFKSYGPVGCKCPGNNKYSTRKSSHEFMKYILFNYYVTLLFLFISNTNILPKCYSSFTASDYYICRYYY